MIFILILAMFGDLALKIFQVQFQVLSVRHDRSNYLLRGFIVNKV